VYKGGTVKLLVTAGPTREFLDPVRFISNRSSGKMGYAVAAAGAAHGHEVVLVSGPVALPAPAGVTLVPVISADDMLAAVRDRVAWCDALVMAAAVADFRPATRSARKLKKRGTSLTLALERTPDILDSVRPLKGRRVFVGFAAETHDIMAEARRKLTAKGLDLIVANDVAAPDAGFEVDTNRVTLLVADGWAEDLPLLTKAEVADRLLAWLERRLAPAAGAGIARRS
jgi:phosphopantothenoylcysteine decarboxylase/phosphopantothenate--cysteine ligase